MSHRSDELARKASLQLEEIIGVLSGLRQEELERPDPGRPSRTLADAAAHMAEGYHHLDRLLQAQVIAPSSAGARHAHGRPPGLALREIIARAIQARPAAARIASLSEEQLDQVPPARSSRFSDGRRTIADIIEAVIAHQAEHLTALRSAVCRRAAAQP